MARSRSRPVRARTAGHTPRGSTATPAAATGSLGDIKQALELVALVVAPTTLVTALLYWIGFELVEARSGYFGIAVGTLGFSTTDYLIRGVEAGIVQVIVLLLAVLAAGLVYAAARRLADRTWNSPWFWRVVWIVFSISGTITVVATYAVFRPLPAPIDWYMLPPLLLATAPLISYSATRLLAPNDMATSLLVRVCAAAVIGITLVSVFWGASLYADALGRGRAQELAAALYGLPRVTVFSERPLGIEPGVAVGQRLLGEEAGRYQIRYTGLRLLVRSDKKYFLLHDRWTPASGKVLVIPDDSEIRVEFSPGGH